MPIEDCTRFGVMGVDEENRIQSFAEKPSEPSPIPDDPGRALVSMGIYVFNPDYLFDRLVTDATATSTSHDFGRDVIPRAIKDSNVLAYRFDQLETNYGSYWRDVGTIDSYWKANMELVHVQPQLNLYDTYWPIRTAIHQHPPAKFVLDENGRRGFAIDSLVGEGSVISGAFVEDSLVSANVRIEEQTVVSSSVILPAVVIGPKCKLRRTVIDKGCHIPAGSEIGFDRTHDEAHFQVTDDGVTLVTPDMLGQTIHRVA
jgi:glucose-1-phosphate adenylyltransferase